MTERVSENTKSILLLTAPLLAPGSGGSGRASGRPSGRSPEEAAKPLDHGEYVALARRLRELGSQPADLIGQGAEALLGRFAEGDGELSAVLGRVRSLLARGLQLSQAVDRWRSRSIWVCSRADPDYPQRLKTRIGEHAPAILYGCGDRASLEAGGLAIVGSRNADEATLAFATAAGELAAGAEVQIVSGGARGIDSAAMDGAIRAEGRSLGVLADSLERSVLQKSWRDAIAAGRLTLISPFDPSARFLVGHAMARNKLIYALADAALIVESEKGAGGTWAGAVEQLERWRCVPLYVRVGMRVDGTTSKGLEALRSKGATPWPQPDAQGLREIVQSRGGRASTATAQAPAGLFDSTTPASRDDSIQMQIGEQNGTLRTNDAAGAASDGCRAEESLFNRVRECASAVLRQPKSVEEFASALGVTKTQGGTWLRRLVDEGVVEKRDRPTRYVALAIDR